MQVGFIGLGTMGARMAANLQQAGYKLVVNDLRKDAAAPHLAAGAIWADTPRALAEQSDVILTSLPEPPDVEKVALAADGLLAGIKRDAVWFDLSTNSQSLVKKLSAAFAEKGAHMLDAPVSGGPQGAASRQARHLGRRRQGRVRQAQGGARRDRRSGALHRADRLGHRRQARAQHVGLRHRLRAGRDLRDGRQGRRRAAGAVGGGAPGRGRPPLHLRRADQSVAARQVRSAGLRAEARAQGRRPRHRARPRARPADAHLRTGLCRDDRGDEPRLGRPRLARGDDAGAGARRHRGQGRSRAIERGAGAAVPGDTDGGKK